MTNKLYSSLILFSALYCSSAFADALITQKLYSGKIGKSSITLQTLQAKNNNSPNQAPPNKTPFAASYFYNSHRVNINLLPSTKGGMNFNEYAADCTYYTNDCKINAVITLNQNGKIFNGEWKSVDNKKSFPIELKLLGERSFNYTENVNDNESLLSLHSKEIYDPQLNPYLLRQTAAETLYSAGENIIGTYGYKIATDKMTGVHYPLLSNSKKKIDLKNINASLNAQRLIMVGYALECKAYTTKDSFWNQYGDWQDYAASPAYASDKILVMEESGSTFCGGAHPNNSFSHRIFEIQSGKELSSEDLFKIYDTKDYDKVKSPKFAEFYQKVTTQKKYIHQ